MLKYANRFNIKVIGVASKKDSLLFKASDVPILLPNVKESDPTGMVPTSSTSITLLFGDCLAVAIMNKIKFSKDRFKVFHPGGQIGNSLLLVKDIMIKGNRLPIVKSNGTISDAIKVINKKKLGFVVVNKNKNLCIGLISDGDIRRSVKNLKKQSNVKDIMTPYPIFISENTPASKALSIMNEKKITSLCVSSELDKTKKEKKLVGVIHIHSLLNYGIK